MLQRLSHQIAYCYQRAGEFREKAILSSDADRKREWLALEGHWMLLARSYQVSERVSEMIEHIEGTLGTHLQRAQPMPSESCPECSKTMGLIDLEPMIADGRLLELLTLSCECGIVLRKTKTRPGFSE